MVCKLTLCVRLCRQATADRPAGIPIEDDTVHLNRRESPTAPSCFSWLLLLLTMTESSATCRWECAAYRTKRAM